MKVVLVVEGNSDTIFFKEQSQWFESLGLAIQIITAGSKSEMTKKARKYCTFARVPNVQSVLFLPDQDLNSCALQTCQQLDVDAFDKVTIIVLKRELEAWVLADSECINSVTGINYRSSGQTDNILDPKQKLFSIFHRAFGYAPSEVEISSRVAPYFSIERAAKSNTSANRFKRFIETM